MDTVYLVDDFQVSGIDSGDGYTYCERIQCH